jgi:hypothetical protein
VAFNTPLEIFKRLIQQGRGSFVLPKFELMIYLTLANPFFHASFILLITLSVSAAAFSRPTTTILPKTHEERTVEFEEVEGEKLNNFNELDLGTPELIGRELNRRTTILLVITKKQCLLSIPHEFLYLLYHNLKLDCPRLYVVNRN